ncbi:Glutathione s-transferase [Lasiodiplodia theobromae]|uniref:Glutathione s-transferase n=1 Tax=Lasiodiplodia theobromae TaxID=45133 RepID=UPI0015C3BD4A|nr:Glutathione s-transferase [Lasiodiplodia theobromae]KAF4542160.1 Glutathione s-transferase [Lasiodiplodia theobromae]
MPPITLFFLQASRSIRTAWLLEELGLDYEIKFWDRQEHQQAPKDAKGACVSPVGRFPTIKDGDLFVFESGAITEYLCAKYDKQHRLLPKVEDDAAANVKILQWIHAAEATFLLHGLAITYARWHYPESTGLPKEGLAAMELGMSANVQNDLDWIERDLSESGSKFLAGDAVTAADVMMQLSADYILERQLGTQGKKWPAVEAWLKRCKETPTYVRAVEKSGYSL